MSGHNQQGQNICNPFNYAEQDPGYLLDSSKFVMMDSSFIPEDKTSTEESKTEINTIQMPNFQKDQFTKDKKVMPTY